MLTIQIFQTVFIVVVNRITRTSNNLPVNFNDTNIHEEWTRFSYLILDRTKEVLAKLKIEREEENKKEW